MENPETQLTFAVFVRFFSLASLRVLPAELLWGQPFVRSRKILRWLFIHGCSVFSLFFILVCLPKLSFLHFLSVLAFFSYIFKLAHCNRQDVRKFIRLLIRVNSREFMHQRDKTTNCSPCFCHRSLRNFCQIREQGKKERNWKLPTSSLQESPQKESQLIESPGTNIRSERMSKGN